ncbi:hypothetical protein GGX14DRAFT_573142 [Mycena pura]|uniref:Uncharacterized protein n=1 Tax=Mycena pura TaxID=153505 RepID=A0AAD6Y2Z9_9AGAR|nr:hypothetical protein GGX14DRAFT_573142 [Mycena pura]
MSSILSPFSRQPKPKEIIIKSKDSSKKPFEGLTSTQEDPRKVIFKHPPGMVSEKGVKPEHGADNELRLREMLKNLTPKPDAKFDSTIDTLIMLARAHSSSGGNTFSMAVRATLDASFYLEDSQVEHEVCNLLRAHVEHGSSSGLFISVPPPTPAFTAPGHGTNLTYPPSPAQVQGHPTAQTLPPVPVSASFAQAPHYNYGTNVSGSQLHVNPSPAHVQAYPAVPPSLPPVQAPHHVSGFQPHVSPSPAQVQGYPAAPPPPPPSLPPVSISAPVPHHVSGSQPHVSPSPEGYPAAPPPPPSLPPMSVSAPFAQAPHSGSQPHVTFPAQVHGYPAAPPPPPPSLLPPMSASAPVAQPPHSGSQPNVTPSSAQVQGPAVQAPPNLPPVSVSAPVAQAPHSGSQPNVTPSSAQVQGPAVQAPPNLPPVSVSAPVAQAPVAQAQAPGHASAPGPQTLSLPLKKPMTGTKNTHYKQSGSVSITAPRELKSTLKIGDIFTYRNTTAQETQAWLYRDGTWTDITQDFNANARIDHPDESEKRILVMKGAPMALDLNWLTLKWAQSFNWGNWNTPDWHT